MARILSACAAVTLAVLASAPGADAAFPGKPGKIVFSATQPAFDSDLFTLTGAGDPVALTDTATIRESDPAYSPDGRMIAFTRDDGTGPEVWVMKADGTGTPQPLTDGGNASLDPSYSPDGRSIAYEHYNGSQTQIYVMDANGNDERPLVPAPLDDGNPVYSPDGRSLAFDRLLPSIGTRVFITSADGTAQPRKLTDVVGYDDSPAFLPDSRRIVFNHGTPTDSARSIWIMNADGSGERPLTIQSEYETSPFVAPDASRVGFLKQGSGSIQDLLTKRLRGGPEVPLVEGLPLSAPDWQPVPVRCGGRRATMVGTPGADRLVGTGARDVIAGLGGRDRLRGGGGNDVLCGGGGADRLKGGPGARDRCIGGPRKDQAASCERRRSI